MKEKKGLASVSECARCGTCCKKGGPCFHLDDKLLIEKGMVLLKDIFTIRKGEMVRDNVKGPLSPAASDIIKTKGKDDFRVCVFFDEKDNRCEIYENRPLECRVLNCRDTTGIERVYSQNRLSREHLLSDIGELWELVRDHQERCDYEKIGKLAAALDQGENRQALEMFSHIFEYDIRIREVLAEKGGTYPYMTDFLFGRPLTRTIAMFGLKLETREGRLRLKKLPGAQGSAFS